MAREQFNSCRREQKEREKKREADMSQSLQKFLPPNKVAMNTESDAAKQHHFQYSLQALENP